MLLAVALVELARSQWVEDVPVLTRCWPVLVQQLMAMSLQFGAISGEDAWTAKLDRSCRASAEPHEGHTGALPLRTSSSNPVRHWLQRNS